ncbi:hypothetical protein KAJ38_02435 [Candidatus Pacearchaeota archaeon]|nr:hypothetical protein [Candidatus Pacearchaeota archaeon]
MKRKQSRNTKNVPRKTNILFEKIKGANKLSAIKSNEVEKKLEKVERLSRRNQGSQVYLFPAYRDKHFKHREGNRKWNAFC